MTLEQILAILSQLDLPEMPPGAAGWKLKVDVDSPPHRPHLSIRLEFKQRLDVDEAMALTAQVNAINKARRK